MRLQLHVRVRTLLPDQHPPAAAAAAAAVAGPLAAHLLLLLLSLQQRHCMHGPGHAQSPLHASRCGGRQPTAGRACSAGQPVPVSTQLSAFIPSTPRSKQQPQQPRGTGSLVIRVTKISSVVLPANNHLLQRAAGWADVAVLRLRRVSSGHKQAPQQRGAAVGRVRNQRQPCLHITRSFASLRHHGTAAQA